MLVDLYAAPLDDSRHRKILEQDLQALELDHAILKRIRIIAADASVCSLPELLR